MSLLPSNINDVYQLSRYKSTEYQSWVSKFLTSLVTYPIPTHDGKQVFQSLQSFLSIFWPEASPVLYVLYLKMQKQFLFTCPLLTPFLVSMYRYMFTWTDILLAFPPLPPPSPALPRVTLMSDVQLVEMEPAASGLASISVRSPPAGPRLLISTRLPSETQNIPGANLKVSPVAECE